MTSHGTSLEMVPLSLNTSLARNHHARPIEWILLLLVGTAMSTNRSGVSELQRAMTGMFT